MSFVGFCEQVNFKLTQGQRILSRVAFDHVSPIALPAKYHAVATDMFGGLSCVPDADILILRCGRGSGKSLLCALHCIYRLCTADLSSVGPGKAAQALVLCPVKEDAEELLDTARKIIEASPLKACLKNPTKQKFSLHLPGRKPVTFKCIAKSARGATGRGKDIIECIIDESEFVASNDASYKITDTELINAMMPRLLKGGRVILASTPWPAESETSKLFDTNFGNPTTALAAFAPTLVMRDNDPHWVDKREKEFKRDAKNAEREYDCVVRGVANSFLEPELVDDAISKSPIFSNRLKTTSGIDLAFRSDSSAHVITDRVALNKVGIVFLEMDTPPKPGTHLVPTEICSKYMGQAAEYKCHISVADSHYIESAREAAIVRHIGIVEGPSMTGDKVHSWNYLRDLFREHKIVIPNNKTLISQLKSIQVKHESGGSVKIIQPRSTGSGHCDLTSALVNAVWRDRRFGRVIVEGSPAKPHLVKSKVVRTSEFEGTGRVG